MVPTCLQETSHPSIMYNSFPFQPLKNSKYRIYKSRYDSIDSYLSTCGEKYNDIDLTIDEDIYAQLLSAGIMRKGRSRCD